MDRNKKKIKNIIMMLAVLLVALVGVFLYLSARRQDISPFYFYLVIGGFLFLFWLLLDFVEPKLLGQFVGISKEQKEAYLKYIVLDLAGYAGIAVFIFSIGESSNSFGLIGAIVYVLTVNGKKNFRRTFLTGPQEEQQE